MLHLTFPKSLHNSSVLMDTVYTKNQWRFLEALGKKKKTSKKVWKVMYFSFEWTPLSGQWAKQDLSLQA